MRRHKVNAEDVQKRDYYMKFMNAVNKNIIELVVNIDDSYIHKTINATTTFFSTQTTDVILKVRAMQKEGGIVSLQRLLMRIKLLETSLTSIGHRLLKHI